MECPVCYKNVGNKKEVNLECGHRFCLDCSTRWLLKDGGTATCPMCREPTEYFDRRTRSQDGMDIYLKNVYIKMELFRMRWYSQKGLHKCHACILMSVTWTLESLVLKKKEKWYRPSMRRALHGLREMMIWVEHNLDRIDTQKAEDRLAGTENCEEHRGREDCKRIMRDLLVMERSLVLSRSA
uniref:RING-type domain-containing protein n=1 Tax=viral metagenome TaxID=1070528 RepID=A0A6C0K2N8_9ZZZZ